MFLFLWICGVFALASQSWAQMPDEWEQLTLQDKNMLRARVLDKWDAMKPEEQEKLREQMRQEWQLQWDQLSEEAKQQRRLRFSEVEDMTNEQRQEYFRTRIADYMIKRAWDKMRKLVSERKGGGSRINLVIDPGKVEGHIDERIYSQSLDSGYHSVNGGLWGEMVWNRSFEEPVRPSPFYKETFLLPLRYWQAYGPGDFEVSGDNPLNSKFSLKITLSGDGFQEHEPVKIDQPADEVEDALAEEGQDEQEEEGEIIWQDEEEITGEEEDEMVGNEQGDLDQETDDIIDQEASAEEAGEVKDAGRPDQTDSSYRNKDEAGILQTPLKMEQGLKYYGSIWARGDKQVTLVVRLVNQVYNSRMYVDTMLAQTEIRMLNDEWKEYKFSLRPEESAENGTLQIGFQGRGTVWIDQVSLISETALQLGGFRPDLLQSIMGMKPAMLRWPGGIYLGGYRWKEGIKAGHKRMQLPGMAGDDLVDYSFGLDEFIRLCRLVEAEPVIVIDISRGVQEACDWVEYCNGPADSPWGGMRAENGHPDPYEVKYWEIANRQGDRAVQDYCEIVKEYVPVMKALDPSIRIVACGSDRQDMDWNIDMLVHGGDYFDYLSLHSYEEPDNFAGGPMRYEKFFQEVGKFIAKSPNPDIKLYISEWNADSTDWRTGLYAAGLLNVFERSSEGVSMASPSLLLRHVSGGARDNALINFNHGSSFPAPNYVVMKLWHDHYGPYRIRLSGNAGGLNAVATRSSDGSKVYFKVVNPLKEPFLVELGVNDAFKVSSANIKLIAPDSLSGRNSLLWPDAVIPIAGRLTPDGQKIEFNLPRWSAAVVTIE